MCTKQQTIYDFYKYSPTRQLTEVEEAIYTFCDSYYGKLTRVGKSFISENMLQCKKDFKYFYLSFALPLR